MIPKVSVSTARFGRNSEDGPVLLYRFCACRYEAREFIYNVKEFVSVRTERGGVVPR